MANEVDDGNKSTKPSTGSYVEFEPRNGYLLVERMKSKTDSIKEAFGLKVPENFQAEEDQTPQVVVRFIGSYAGELHASHGDLLVVERSQVETIHFGEYKYDIVHSRNVLGIFTSH